MNSHFFHSRLSLSKSSFTGWKSGKNPTQSRNRNRSREPFPISLANNSHSEVSAWQKKVFYGVKPRSDSGRSCNLSLSLSTPLFRKKVRVSRFPVCPLNFFRRRQNTFFPHFLAKKTFLRKSDHVLMPESTFGPRDSRNYCLFSCLVTFQLALDPSSPTFLSSLFLLDEKGRERNMSEREEKSSNSPTFEKAFLSHRSFSLLASNVLLKLLFSSQVV